MRTSEWIQGSFAVILAIAAWTVSLPARRRWVITVLAACAIVVIVLASQLKYLLGGNPASIIRDWLPVPLTLIPYWQTGQFFTGPNEKIQAWLVESDRRLLNLVPRTGWKLGRFARLSMEWAYMLCYVLAPLGLGALCAAGLRRDADTFWFLVLVPTYICYGFTPFVPALPPRSLERQPSGARATKSRVFNQWILKHGSIQAISFPSAHAASALAVSLVLLHYVPIGGLIFLAISFWVGVAAVVGRYHYAIDVALGGLVALGIYLAWSAHLIPSSLITAPAMALVAPLCGLPS
jgi:membrane-associated phospholipid phosphatase